LRHPAIPSWTGGIPNSLKGMKMEGVEIIGRRYLPLYLKRLQNRLSASEAQKIFDILKLSQSQMFV